ncbi:MAG: hypothetical protein HZA31_06705 [Opitutae bacterium]|nr:hypothetical protein [Opitutae bacterium]
MAPGPQSPPVQRPALLWSFLEETPWTEATLTAAVSELLAATPTADTLLAHWRRLHDTKLAPDIGDRRQAALAAAGIALAAALQEQALRPASPATPPARALTHAALAARNAWQSVETPDVYCLWLKPDLQPRWTALYATLLARVADAPDAALQADARLRALLTETSDFVTGHIPELAAHADALRARLAPLHAAAEQARRREQRARHGDTLLEQLRTAPASDAGAFAQRLGALAAFVAADPWILAERTAPLVALLADLPTRLTAPGTPRLAPPLAEAAGKLAAAVANAAGTSPDLRLLHGALSLASAVQRQREESSRAELVRLARQAFFAARAATVAGAGATAPLFKAAGEIAALHLRTVQGGLRLASARAGDTWFRAAFPGGYGEVPPTVRPTQLAWWECLEITRQRGEIEKALRAWLLPPGCPPELARRFTLRLAELKLADIEVTGRDTIPSEINGVKSLLRKAAAPRTPVIDPLVAPLPDPAEAPIHLRLAQLHLALAEWADAERQLGYFLAAQPARPPDGARRRVRAQASAWLGRALAAQEKWPQAEQAYRDSLTEQWTAAAQLGYWQVLQGSGALEVWADTLTDDPPRGAAVSDDPQAEAYVLAVLRDHAELRAAVLARIERWSQRSFFATLLRRGLTPDHPLTAELRPALHALRRHISPDTRLLAQQLASWRYLENAPAGEPGGDFATALERWAPLQPSARELAEHVQTALEAAVQVTLRDHVGRLIAALRDRDAAALRRELAGERWQTQFPAGYKHLDSFDLVDRLRRWTADWQTAAKARASAWTISDIAGDSFWIRGAAWLALRAELHGLFAPDTGALAPLFAPGPAGGVIAGRVQERELVFTVQPAAPFAPEPRAALDAAVAQWLATVPEGRMPTAGWNAAGTAWQLTLKVAGSASRESTPLADAAMRQLERLLLGGRTAAGTLTASAADWLAATPRRETAAALQRLLRWAHDFATLRTRLWLVEETAANPARHPRFALQRYRDAAALDADAEAYARGLQRFLHYRFGRMPVLDLTTLVRTVATRRRTQAGGLVYRLELEPDCRVRWPADVAEYTLQTLCASAEKTARAVATNAELIVRLRPEGQKIALEISNPCQKKSDPATAGALRPETWADLVRLDRGECTVVATQRHQQCTLKFPAEAEGLEPRHAPRKPL